MPRYMATNRVVAVTESEITFPPENQLIATYITAETTANEIVPKSGVK